MSEAILEQPTLFVERPDISHIETEDDTPVDNMYSEKQMRFLVAVLYASWKNPTGEPFAAMANVGYFYALYQPPLVPDVLLSLNVELPEELHEKHHRSYFLWEYGKPPDVIVEVVSNKKGGELSKKKKKYAQLNIPYYIVHDPEHHLSEQKLHVFELVRGSYVPIDEYWLERANIGIRLWQGVFENVEEEWVRWCYQDGTLVPTAAEVAEDEAEARELAEDRAEQAEDRVERAEDRAERAENQARLEARARDAAEAEIERLRAELKRLQG